MSIRHFSRKMLEALGPGFQVSDCTMRYAPNTNGRHCIWTAHIKASASPRWVKVSRRLGSDYDAEDAAAKIAGAFKQHPMPDPNDKPGVDEIELPAMARKDGR